MTAIAVNCLLTDARRKLVWASILPKVRRSATPYPRANTAWPFLITSTAPPGAVFDFNSAKIASIFAGSTCAATPILEFNTIISTTIPPSNFTKSLRQLRSDSSYSQHPARNSVFLAMRKQQVGAARRAKGGRSDIFCGYPSVNQLAAIGLD